MFCAIKYCIPDFSLSLFYFSCWPLEVYCQLGSRHLVGGVRKAQERPWRVMSRVFSVLSGVLLFSYKIDQWLLAWVCLVSGWDPERRSSNKLSVWGRILAVGGGHWRRGPRLGFAGLTTGLLLPVASRAESQPCRWRPGKFRELGTPVWPEWESGLATRKLRYQGRGWPWGDGRGGEAFPRCSALLRELILEVEPRRPRWSWASFEARMWAGGNLGCSASPASVHGRLLGWWEQGQLASAPVCEEISGATPVVKLTRLISNLSMHWAV